MSAKVTRRCGDCQLCCTLLPTRELSKPANTRCSHQRHGKGCCIYESRPLPCRLWACRWLVDDDAADLRRPDRAGYVVDMMPDYIRIQPEGAPERRVEVVQIWVDPKRPYSYRDPALMAWLMRRADTGVLGLVRHGSRDGIVIFPPTDGGQWTEVGSCIQEPEHSAADVARFIRSGAA